MKSENSGLNQEETPENSLDDVLTGRGEEDYVRSPFSRYPFLKGISS